MCSGHRGCVVMFVAGSTIKAVVPGDAASTAASLTPDTQSSVAPVPERETSTTHFPLFPLFFMLYLYIGFL